MKTNHRRNFTDPGSRTRNEVGYITKVIGDKVFHTKIFGDSSYGGHKQAAREKAAAKRFIRQAERRDGKRQCRESEKV